MVHLHSSFACQTKSILLNYSKIVLKATFHNISFVVMQDGGGVQSRWELIHTALRGLFKSSLDVRVRQEV